MGATLGLHAKTSRSRTSAASFGAAMQYFTGSKEHNIVTRRLAQQRDLKLNEYGLFRDEDGEAEHRVQAALPNHLVVDAT